MNPSSTTDNNKTGNGVEMQKQEKETVTPQEPEKTPEVKEEVAKDGRIFEFGNGASRSRFMSNFISTTRYTLLPFKIHKEGWHIFGKNLPWIQPMFVIQNFLEQLSRIANIYFGIIILLQLIPGISPTGQFSTLLPFTIVTLFSMAKDGLEDLKRYFSDLAINKGSKATAWRNGEWKVIQWKNVKVGDILKISNRERFPCDLIALSSSQENGLLYVETSSLDGETNLKLKTCKEATMCINDYNVNDVHATVKCEAPNKSLYTFGGNVTINNEFWWTSDVNAPKMDFDDPSYRGTVKDILVSVGDQVNKDDVIMTIQAKDRIVEIKSAYDNLNVKDIYVAKGNDVGFGEKLYQLNRRMVEYENKTINMDETTQCLRGSSLRNTDWIIGVAIFTGHDTKLMKNQKQTPRKFSKVEHLTNKLIYIIFGVLICLAFVCAVGTMIQSALWTPNMWYAQELQGGATWYDILWQGFAGFWTFLILFNNLVPISLYVTVEMAKFAQGYFMSQDLDMYYGKEGEDIPCTVRSSSLNEELGTVEYIFSDKTGTLTCNKMDFLKFGVNGRVYGTGKTEIEMSNARRRGETLVNDRPDGFDEDQDFRFWDNRIMSTDSAGINNYHYFENDSFQDSALTTEFFKLLALCHTVIPEKLDGGIKYTSSSPDEEALVKAARSLGVEFLHRTTSSMTIKIHANDTKETYTLLNTLEFTSKRKRMSVIVRDPEGKLWLLIKGADNVIYDRLAADSPHTEVTSKNLGVLAEAGLRTLVCAKAELDEEFYKTWNKEFQEAIELTDVKEKKRRLETINAKIEKDLYLVGITAIEDKLQKDVPNTIAELKKGQIKVWVLTGDKQETAKNIGFACDLLNSDMDLVELENTDPGKLSTELLEAYEKYKNKPEDLKLGLIVDGKKLAIIMEDKVLKHTFLMLGTICAAVVCCRVSPSQKADVVLLVKNNMETITLAIGDGANDVAMIQSAHVGVGIAGKEGLQAANSSDYSFGQFRFLKPLLLIHGRYNYRRVCKIILYSFYKNIVLYLTQMWFVFFNAFTGTSVHDKWTVSTYNVFFTFLPIMALGIWDRDMPKKKVLMFPELYARGQQNVYFNAWNFMGWMANAIFHSAICFFIPMMCLYWPNNRGLPYNGDVADMLSLGIAVYTSTLLTVTMKVYLEMASYGLWQILSIIASVGVWWLFIFVYGSFYYIYPQYVFVFEDTYNILEQWKNFFSIRFYATVLLTTVIACTRDLVWKSLIRIIRPSLYYAVQDTPTYALQKKMDDPTLSKDEHDRLVHEWDDLQSYLVAKYPLKQGKPQFKRKGPIDFIKGLFAKKDEDVSSQP